MHIDVMNATGQGYTSLSVIQAHVTCIEVMGLSLYETYYAPSLIYISDACNYTATI